jgi:hypothetical protein
VLAFGDSDEDAQLLEGHAVIVTAKVRGKARHSSTISARAPTPHAAHTDRGLHRPGSGVTDSVQATTRSLGWDEAIWDDSHLADGIIMRESKPGAPQSHHGCRLKAPLPAAPESWPAVPAMDLRLWAPLLVRVPRNDGRADRFNDFADPFDSCFQRAGPQT